MTWHEKILSPRQRRALHSLGAVCTDSGFYLGGGTAIALRLGHRRSLDLDWFTSGPLGDPVGFAERLRAAGVRFVMQETAPATLYGAVHGARVSFFAYQYPLLRRPQLWAAFRCRVAHLGDLAAMKLVALSQRGSKKDFVDLYALCRKHAALKRLLQLYEKKYRVAVGGHLLASLVYFQDADRQRMPALLWKLRWQEIKQSMRQWVKELGHLQ